MPTDLQEDLRVYRYIVPYVFAAFFLLVILFMGGQYLFAAFLLLSILSTVAQNGYWFICKYGFGREDPIDPKELLDSLTEEERKEAVKAIIRKASTTTTTTATTEESREVIAEEDDSNSVVVKKDTKTVEEGIDLEMQSSGRCLHAEITLPLSDDDDDDDDDDEKDIDYQKDAVQACVSISDLESGNFLESDGDDSSKGESDRDGEESLVVDSQSDTDTTKDEREDCQGEAAEEQETETTKTNISTPHDSPLLYHYIDEDLTSIDDEENVCPICLGRFEDADPVFQSKACTHKFHEDCIVAWLSAKNHNDCPVCRTVMISEDDLVEEALVVIKKRKTRR